MSQPLQEPRRARGEPEAEASRLYHEYHDKLLRYCAGQLRSREEAEDAVQNTFLRVFTALRKGVVPEFEGPWVYKIAHNVCLSKRLGSTRRARVETPADLDLLGDRAAAYSAETDELFGLDDALADMPANLRRPLLMREWQGMSYAEIADALGVSHSAVETLIFRARRHLATALTDSVKKSGKAIASVFNIRWLFDLMRGLGGGVGGAGMAAGAVGLVVAIGGGVALDLATQHAGAARRLSSPAVARPSATPLAATRSSVPARSVATPKDFLRGARSTGGAGSAHGGGSASKPGRGSAGGASPSGGNSPANRPGAVAVSPAPTSGHESPSPSQPAAKPDKGSSGGTGGSSGSPGKVGSPKPPAPPAPPALPGAPPLLPPPALPPPALPPVPPVPPLPALPTISVPGSLAVEATGPLGAVVHFTATATDAAGASLPVTCSPGAGSTFPLGQTTVSCSATDSHGGTSSASFGVQVKDTTPPALTVPADISIKTSLTGGTTVTYTATATDLVDAAPKVSCSPASGSLFLVKTTTVTCTATDSSGNSSSKSFHVTVTLVPAVPPPPL